MLLEIGKEYVYLDQFVKIIEIYGKEPDRGCLIETRFGSRTIVEEIDLKEKK